MSKRFISTSVFEDRWFVNLSPKNKLFWLYLITQCNYAGFWPVNLKYASYVIGEYLDLDECLEFLEDRIIKVKNGELWFIPGFLLFQYGTELNPNNRAHLGVIKELQKYKVINKTYEDIEKISDYMGLARTLDTLKEKDKDKDTDTDKEMEKEKEKEREYEREDECETLDEYETEDEEVLINETSVESSIQKKPDYSEKEESLFMEEEILKSEKEDFSAGKEAAAERAGIQRRGFLLLILRFARKVLKGNG